MGASKYSQRANPIVSQGGTPLRQQKEARPFTSTTIVEPRVRACNRSNRGHLNSHKGRTPLFHNEARPFANARRHAPSTEALLNPGMEVKGGLIDVGMGIFEEGHDFSNGDTPGIFEDQAASDNIVCVLGFPRFSQPLTLTLRL